MEPLLKVFTNSTPTLNGFFGHTVIQLIEIPGPFRVMLNRGSAGPTNVMQQPLGPNNRFFLLRRP